MIDFDPAGAGGIYAGSYANRPDYNFLVKLNAAEGTVVWQKHKTNRDYQAEVQRAGRTDLAVPFGEVTRLFAWVWYGEAPVDAARYARMAASFDRVEAALRGAGEGVIG